MSWRPKPSKRRLAYDRAFFSGEHLPNRVIA